MLGSWEMVCLVVLSSLMVLSPLMFLLLLWDFK